MQNKEGENTKGTRGGLRKRERVNSTSVMELWTEKERKKEQQAKKRTRQEEEGDEIPKRSKAIEITPRKKTTSESEAEKGEKDVITAIRIKDRFKAGNSRIEERSQRDKGRMEEENGKSGE